MPLTIRWRLPALPVAFLLLSGPSSVAAPMRDEAALACPAGPAQAMVDEFVAQDPALLDLLIHVTPPAGRHNIVVAAHIRERVGEVSGNDDLAVMHTGKPAIEVQKDGVRIGVVEQLRDRSGRPIGALGELYSYKAGEDPAAFVQKAQRVRDRLASRIPSLRSLFAACPIHG